MTKLRANQVATQLGVTTQSIRRYVNEGRLKADHTPSGQRVFLQEYVDEFLGIKPAVTKTIAYYLRSSNGNKVLLDNQLEELQNAYGITENVYMDKSSGLNSKRKGLKRLLDDAEKGIFNTLVITQKDRLTRFGYEYLERLLKVYGVTIIILNDKDDKTLQDELMQDFMNLIASFSGKFYRLRGYEQQRKLLQEAGTRIS